MIHVIYGLAFIGLALWVSGVPAAKEWWPLMLACIVFLAAAILEFLTAAGIQ